MVTKRFFSLFVFAALAVILTLTIREAAATISVTRSIPNTGGVQDAEWAKRVHDTEAARLNGLAQEYFAKQTQEAERVKRVQEAESARLNGMADEYFEKLAKEGERVSRVQAAESARLNGLAQEYFTKQTQQAPTGQ